jgi:hypothetical protein
MSESCPSFAFFSQVVLQTKLSYAIPWRLQRRGNSLLTAAFAPLDFCGAQAMHAVWHAIVHIH